MSASLVTIQNRKRTFFGRDFLKLMVITFLSQGAIGEMGSEGAAGNDGARVSNGDNT